MVVRWKGLLAGTAGGLGAVFLLMPLSAVKKGRRVTEHLGEGGFGGMDPVEDPHEDVRRERDALKRQVKSLTEDLANALGGKWTALEIGRAVREAEKARKTLGWGDGELNALRLKLEARIDCHAGPGTTEPACGSCSKCLIDAVAVAETKYTQFKDQVDDLLHNAGLCAAKECEGHCGFSRWQGCAAVKEWLSDARKEFEEILARSNSKAAPENKQ